jgi:hypothetical protein
MTGGSVASDDDAIMARFVSDYLALLDQRVSTITAELETGTDLNAHVALLSLESASTMVGATELAKLVGLLRSEVERGQRIHIGGLVKAITIEAAQLRGRLDPAKA